MAHTVVLEIDGVAYDDKTVDGVTIRYGRQSVEDQPEPTSLSAVLLRDTSLGTIDVADVKVGSTIRLEVTPSGQPALRRFWGVITDVSVDKDTLQIAATSNGIYAMRQLKTAGATFPNLTGVEDTAYIAAASLYVQSLIDLGIPDPDNKPDAFPDFYSDASTFPNVSISADSNVPIRIDDVLRQAIEATPGGVISELMDVYSGNENVAVFLNGQASRTGPLVADVVLTTTEMGDDWTATRDLGLFCTVAGVDYSGPWTITLDVPPNDYTFDYLAQGSVTYIANVTPTQGPYATQISTRLINESDAELLAKYLTDVGVVPGYVCDITVPLATLTEARQYAIVEDLFVGTLWETPAFATGLPIYWYLEGYDEEVRRNDWTVRVRLSDVRNSWSGQAWQDVTATLEWGQVPATTTWLDLQGEEL